MAALAVSSTPSTTSTLPGFYYTSADLLREEFERIFYENWVCCGREEKISRPGQYFLQEIGTENIIILRDQQGEVRAFYNVCRHRGTRMCTEPNGKFSNSIQCPYHAWTYALDGRLIGGPHMEDVSAFEKSEYPLNSVGVKVWEGMIYINLSHQPQAFEEVFGTLQNKFTNWNLPALKAGGKIEYDVKANWKLIVENYSECYHCPLVHPELSSLSPYRSGENDLSNGPFLGGSMLLNHDVGSLTMSREACGVPISGVSDKDMDKVYYYSIFPNSLLSLHPDYVMLHTLWPQSYDRTLIICEWLFEPETLESAEFNPQDAIGFWDITNRQDWHVCELSQLGVQSRSYRPGPYSALEKMSSAFDRYYLQQMED
jgi:Rieske 2Fe-2S family protein